VEPPVDAAFSFATAVDTALLASVICDRTVEMPVVVVESEPDRLVKALRPPETCALVGDAPSATMVEIAVENRTAVEVVAERLVLSSVAPLSAVETTTPAEVVVESAVDVIPESDVWVDLAVLAEDDMVVLSDTPDETCVVCEVWADRRLETVVDSELLALRTDEIEPVTVAGVSTASRTFVGG
jgi:hypothetical protein